MIELLSDQRAIVLGIVAIAGVGATISTLEWISNRQQLQDGGLYCWEIVGSRPLAVGNRIQARVAQQTLKYESYLGILWTRLGAVVSVPVAVWTGSYIATVLSLLLVVLTTLVMNVRSIYGMDGSDQMTTQVYGALLLGYLPHTALALNAALWYIALQACLAYFTSGIAKAISPVWRAGGTVYRIFNTRTYGYEPVARFLKDRPRLNKFLDWSGFGVESIFPLALVVGFPAVLVFIAWGIAFHAMNALVMGLNSFFWAFCATYPAIVYVAVSVGGGAS